MQTERRCKPIIVQVSAQAGLLCRFQSVTISLFLHSFRHSSMVNMDIDYVIY